MAANELPKEWRKEGDEDTFQLNTISGFNDYWVGAEILPETYINSRISQKRC